MFCHKCGNQIADTAAFCPKCGVKLTANDTAQQTAAPTSAGQLQPQVNNPQPDIAQKKKSRKLPIIVGAIAIALAFVVILIAANFDDLQERGEQARKDEEYIASQQQSSDIKSIEAISMAWIPICTGLILSEKGRCQQTMNGFLMQL